MTAIRSDRRLYLTGDRERVVEHGDPEAAFLLCGEGGKISARAVERSGLGVDDDDRVRIGRKKATPAEDKMRGPEEDKAAGGKWELKLSPEEYLKRHPDGPNAGLARELVDEV